MGGECTQILLDALLIANVGKYIVKTANSDPSNAGIWSPDCPIRVKSPTVLKKRFYHPCLDPSQSEGQTNRQPRC